jgi:hypothetical protein
LHERIRRGREHDAARAKSQQPKPAGQWHPEEWQAEVHEAAWAAMKERPFVWGTFVWKNPEKNFSGFLFERLAATYSRGSYTTTTIGHAVFDGRVRNGNGSDHCGIATKLLYTARGFAVQNFVKDRIRSRFGDSLKTTHRSTMGFLQFAS